MAVFCIGLFVCLYVCVSDLCQREMIVMATVSSPAPITQVKIFGTRAGIDYGELSRVVDRTSQRTQLS